MQLTLGTPKRRRAQILPVKTKRSTSAQGSRSDLETASTPDASASSVWQPRTAISAAGSRASEPTTWTRARDCDSPQDRAFYSCGCGFAFTASVATDINCPHCGAEQTW